MFLNVLRLREYSDASIAPFYQIGDHFQQRSADENYAIRIVLLYHSLSFNSDGFEQARHVVPPFMFAALEVFASLACYPGRVRVGMFVRMFMYVCVCLCVFLCMFVRMFVCVCVCIYQLSLLFNLYMCVLVVTFFL